MVIHSWRWGVARVGWTACDPAKGSSTVILHVLLAPSEDPLWLDGWELGN